MTKVVDTITEFDYYDQDVKIGASRVKILLKAPEPPAWESKQLIAFVTKKGEYVKLDLTGTYEETNVLGLYWKNFSNVELTVLGNLFGLKLSQAKNINGKDNLIADIDDSGFKSYAELAIKQAVYKKTYYAVVYYLSRPDKIFEGKLYIHGIWELMLSEELKQKLTQ